MSALVVLTCEHESTVGTSSVSGRCSVQSDPISGATVEQVRQLWHAHGWRTHRGPHHDVCPRHARALGIP